MPWLQVLSAISAVAHEPSMFLHLPVNVWGSKRRDKSGMKQTEDVGVRNC